MSLERLGSIILSSGLLAEQQAEFLSYFQPAGEEQMIKVAEILQIHPAWIQPLYQNISRKKEILARGDMAAWQKLLLDEFSQITEGM
ncbi:hypothetical protein EXS71_03535 [Candidatus Uhrbacteria bacterium]|nr:hypothetical protein [Candidatus Uhrbacteria bacterium]